MSKKDDVFKNALEGKKIPVLILDNKWHKLFNHVDSTHEINELEERMNELIKRQGKVNTESKDIKKLKKTLMNEVMVIADNLMKSPNSKRLNKEMDVHKRLIEECNEKLNDYEEEMLELPREIDRTNKKLMLATMETCYKKLQENTKELSIINEWISNIRRELKKKMVRKQEKEAQNNELYSYMHDIFGADVIEIFDMKYNPDRYSEDNSNGTENWEED
ncbi:MAG: hypothetical protein HDR12_14180 [Lachnospiraceae bacterium]|nr:hypothetical protein [Lachnospiraceae bacterium]